MLDVYWRNFKFLFLEQIDGIYYSDLILILFISALVSVVPGYVLFIKKGISKKQIALAFFTFLYMGIMLMITVFRREPGTKNGSISVHLNLGLTRTTVYSARQVIYSALNFALFVPWGIILGLHRHSQNMIRIIVMSSLIGFITSFMIEVIQLITGTGRFEVTDLLTNVAGTFFGAICVAIGVKIKRMAEK